jgi:hypothetical protein
MPIVGNAINVPVADQPEGAGTTMPHSDIVPEHECNGELIEVSDTKYVTKTW